MCACEKSVVGVKILHLTTAEFIQFSLVYDVVCSSNASVDFGTLLKLEMRNRSRNYVEMLKKKPGL